MLIVAGHPYDPAYSSWLRDQIPQATVTVMPGSGHFPQLGHPEAFADLLTDTGRWRRPAHARPETRLPLGLGILVGGFGGGVIQKKVVVNDRMQQGYIYYLTEPEGEDFRPAFTPDLTPAEMLQLGVFGGRYMTDCRDEFPASWFEKPSSLLDPMTLG